MQIPPELYSLTISLPSWALLGAMLLIMITIAAILWPKLLRVRREVRRDNAQTADIASSAIAFPPVSVIVYSQADGVNLRTLLPQILNQDYPAPMEVIVVNDESSDDTETIVTELEMKYSHLYMTFAPENSRNLSRRKLAITLGIKAARYDSLLLTCGNCRISSPLWMRSMMRHMAAGKEVVIGYATEAATDAAADTDRRRRRRAFDNLWESVRFLSAAICGHPLRATGFNLAYTRRLFFDHKGFSRTLNLQYGDDDIFINEIATGANTAVELSDDSRVIATNHSPDRIHDIYRLRRDFTARRLPRTAYRSMGLTSALQWLWPLCGVAASLLALPSLIVAAGALLLTILFLALNSMMWRRTAIALGVRPMRWATPWLSWTRPFRTLRHRIRCFRSRHLNLTFSA